MKRSVRCPGCGKETPVTFASAIDEDNSVSLRFGMKERHMMQAAELGRLVLALDKLLKASGRELGAVVDVLVKDLWVKEEEVGITVSILPVAKRKGSDAK